jgi:hypothetical protein
MIHDDKPVKRRRQASMRGENGVVDKGSQGQVIEEVGKVLPHICSAVHAEALIVETVHLRDLPTHMQSQKVSPRRTSMRVPSYNPV